jgi:hypothetical protein
MSGTYASPQVQGEMQVLVGELLQADRALSRHRRWPRRHLIVHDIDPRRPLEPLTPPDMRTLMPLRERTLLRRPTECCSLFVGAIGPA